MPTPKVFIIRCVSGCRWAEMSTGLKDDLKHLTEITDNCSHCGRPRTFFCPQCNKKAKMFRLAGRK